MIDNIELLAFIKENLALARTVVIKNEDVAILDNLAMLNYYGIKTPKDKAKWRYYLNLNGDYHETDDVMTVQSLDDNELIPFTKEVLVDHPATKKAYRLGSYYFSRLAAKYPHQIDLIQGIINPIPPEESIPAKPYQILRYTKDYVHWNESQLIPALQSQIDQVVYQSFNTEYKYSDDLMLPFLIAHLRESVFKFLLQCRFEHRYTRYAHPFYIWSHLQSRGISPIYKDLLNNKQTMWLFRNIDWVLRNLGQTKTFKDLIQILLTERNIPLAKYDLLQSTEDMSTTLNPGPLFYSERLNLIETRGLGQTFNQIPHVMLKEIPESIDNELNYDKYLPTTIDESTYGLVTSYPIKVLDSELVDTTNRKTETFFSLLNNELIYLSGKGLYNINLDIEEPLTGIHQRISVSDAVVLWHHLLNCYNGATCDNIPSFYYHRVLRITPVTLDEMMSVGTKPFLNEAWCNDVLKTLIPQIKMVSPSAFYENVFAIYSLKWTHKKMYSRYPSIGYYSHRKNAISTAYESGFIKLTDKKTYTAFLEQYDFDFSRYQKDDYFSLMWEIWQKATGWDQFSHITVAQIQSGMIGLMRFLSSYSIQFIHQTTLEDGWFEGGLDLLTENPMLLNHDSENSPELELNVESARIPVHHRVVNRFLEQEELYHGNAPFDSGTIEAELTERGRVYETPRLYDVELDDDDKDNGAYSNQLIDLLNRYRPFTGTLPYDVEDLIPTGGDKYDQHTLKEMIVDVFEGIKKVGPWEAIGIRIPDNGLDNANVAETVDAVSYEKVVQTESVDDDKNRYFIGFSPEETGDHLIKLDVIIRHTQTQEISYLRFDYNTVTKQKTWAITFDIPQSVTLNNPFEITPVITGLQLARAGTILEEYYVYDEIRPYLTIDNSNGRPMGTFLKEGWPEDLPVMYIMTTQDGDDIASLHTYFMKGYIPSDRYYDPLTDTEFDPVIRYNEADRHAITLENFTMTASHHGWQVTDLYLQKDEEGNYPEQVKTDYLGIKDYLSPTLSEQRYVDEEKDGKTYRTFEWFYAVADDSVSLDMVLELTNEDDGTVVQKHFTYTPTVVDHGTQCTLSILPDDDFKFGIGYSSITHLTVTGLGEKVVIDRGDNVTLLPDQTGKVAIDYAPVNVDDNKIDRYTVKPYEALENDTQWAVKLHCHTPSLKGEDLTVIPYSSFTILATDVVDYDVINPQDIRFKGWENNPIYAHAIVPSRYAISDLINGWVMESAEVVKTNGAWPEFVGTVLPGLTSVYDIGGFDPYIKVGVGTDGTQTVPEGYDRWFTVYMLANRDYLNNQNTDLAIPIKLTLTNKYTGKSGSVQINPLNAFVGVMFVAQQEPDKLVASKVNHVVPTWASVPVEQFGNTLMSSEGIFLGLDRYKGGEDYADVAIGAWNTADNTADITLPKAPLSDGQGIRIYNKKRYKSTDERFKDSSVEEVVYYPYVDYTRDMIERVPVPTYDELDFTALETMPFFQGIRTAQITLMNNSKLQENNWSIASVNMKVYNTDQQDAVMMTRVDDVTLTEHMYIHGVQDFPVDDAPEGKENYLPLYVGFVPAKEGKQTIDVVLTLENTTVADIPNATYTYQFEADVQPKEGKIVYDSTYPDPWWLVNEHTFVLANIEDYSGYPNYASMSLVTTRDEFGQYVDVALADRSSVSSHPVIDLVVKERFTEITPRLIIGYDAYFGQYSNGNLQDVRNTRVYYGTLPVNPDRLYTLDEFVLDDLNFRPDAVFDEMALNTVYTERYAYSRQAKGWEPGIIRLQENTDWMAHVFRYNDDQHINGLLFVNHIQNQIRDRDWQAMDGDLFYLPTYGSRKTGQYPISIVIDMRSDHHEYDIMKSFVFNTTKIVNDTGVALKYTNDVLYIGKRNVLEGGFINVPEDDINENVIEDQTAVQVLGDYAGYVYADTNPTVMVINENYPQGDDHNVMVAAWVAYTGVKEGGVVETATDFRFYRGEYVFEGKTIEEYVDYPELSDFDFTALGGVDFYQGIRSTAVVLYNGNGIANKGWTITNISMAAYGASNQDDILLTQFDSKDLSSKAYQVAALSTLPSDTPEGKKAYKGHSFSFVPAKSGKQTFDILIDVTDGKHTKQYTYALELDVAEKQGEVRWDNSDTDPWWLVGRETYYLTALYDAPSTLTTSVFESVEVNDRTASLLSASVKTNRYLSSTPALAVLVSEKTTGADPNVIAVYHATFSGYDNNDPRAVKYYFDVLPIHADHQYTLDELDATVVDIKPDIVFDEMKVNQVYTERYTYLKAGSKGWEPTILKPVEEQDWMAHVFEYGGEVKTSENLFYYVSNKTYDHANVAPTGRAFFMPTYGGRKTGSYSMTVSITLSNKHFNSTLRTTVGYEIQRKIIESPFALELTYNELYIGKKTELQGGMINIPDTDVNPTLIPTTTNMMALGINADGITPSTDPYAVEIVPRYKPSTAKGFMLAVEVRYTKTNSIDVSTDTQHRAYRGTQIIPKEAIVEYVAFPELEDIDFTPIGGVDFFKGVRSTYVTLYNSSAPNETEWWISKIQLDVVGTATQDDNIITVIDGRDLGELAYNTDAYPNYVSDAPAGKDKYYTIVTTFIPAKEGKQTFGVTATVTVDAEQGFKTKDYHFDIVIDVKPKEGQIAYIASEPNPWWAIGKETYALTELTGYSGQMQNNVLTYVSVVDEFTQYLTAKRGVNNALSGEVALGVTIKEAFTDITPRIIVAYDMTLGGYRSNDPRNTRVYFDIVQVNRSHIYNVDDITLDLVEFKPDIVFDEMGVNEAYTERYVYNRDTRGWMVKTMRLQENTDWMAHVFTYDNDTQIVDTLFSNNSQNKTLDSSTVADEGKYFYLPRYGSRTVGQYDVNINITLINNHLTGSVTKELQYSTKRNIVASGVALNFTYEGMYIGRENPLTGGLTNVPTSDLSSSVVAEETNSIMVIGANRSQFKIRYGARAIEVNKDYEAGSGNGFMLGMVSPYTKQKSGSTVASETEFRVYRGEQIVPETDISLKVEQPDDTDFDFTPLPSTLIQGVVCTLAYMYDVNTIKEKGWACEDSGLTAFGTDEQADVMIDSIEGKTFDDGYLYRYGKQDFIPSDAPGYAANYQYGYVTFVPAKEGKQTIEVTIQIKQGSSTASFSFPVDVNVKPHEGSIGYGGSTTDPFFFLNYGVTLTTALTGYSGTLTNDVFSLATMVPRDESYFTVTLSGNNMVVTSVKDVEDIDRGIIVGHTVTVEGYGSDDKRGVRTYYDVIWVDNTHVYSLDNLKPSLVDLKGDVVFETMDLNTAYSERYSYLRAGPSGWVVESTKLVEDKTWMAHVFEYDGATITNGQLLSTGRYKQTYDRDITAPSDRWFSLPCYGSRELGDFEVTLEVAIATTQFGRRMSGTIKYKFMRRIVDSGVGVIMVYDKLKAGATTNVGVTSTNIPGSDVKEGVIAANVLYSKVGSMASYFTYNRSPTSVAITSGYPVGSGKGVMLTFIYPYTARRAGHNAHSDTDNRVYRGTVIIKDGDITN